MTTLQAGRIFINYRRVDTQAWAGRIYDRLATHFDRDALFMDVDAMDAGIDFVQFVENAVQTCDVLIALIGREWLTVIDEAGNRRLDNPDDYVRIEIEAALKRNIRVIPILVDGTSMPKLANLPEDLKPLSRHNALTVDHHTFTADIDRLIRQLERALKEAENSRLLKVKYIQEESARKERDVQINKLRHQSNTAMSLADWQLAQEKLKRILDLDVKDIEAQANLEIVEKKLVESKKKEERERKAAEKARLERIDNIKKFFWKHGKGLSIIGGGIVLIFLFANVINNIEIPVRPESTKTPANSITTTATLKPSTSTSLPASPSLPTKTPTPTKISASPTPELGIGSALISEKDGMVMVYVPAGEFTMGSDADDALAECQKFRSDCSRSWFTDEEPAHQVDLDAFWIDKTEVTNAMYAKCVADGDCEPPSPSSSYTHDSYYGNSTYDDYPVIYVNWSKAAAYCKWAGRELLTEAEWEKASRGTDGRTYPWGEEINCSYANYWGKDGGCVGDTSVVGSYPGGASIYGALDMAGNVWEWVNDWYSDTYYKSSPSSNPLGSSYGQYRVVRGGSWDFNGYVVRSADRVRGDPANSNHYVGFRCSISP